MKVIVLIALLALTQAAVVTNITAYRLGFDDQIGFDISQTQDAETCYTASDRVAEDLRNVLSAIQNQGGLQVAGAISDLIASVDDAVNIDCVSFKEDLLSTFYQNANGTDLQTVAQENFNTYPTQIVQQVALWLQALIDGDDYTAGKTEAYVYQILFGLETPEVLPVPQDSEYVPLNASNLDTYFSQLYQGVYSGMGITNQTIIDQTNACITNYADTIIFISTQFNITDDFGHNIQAVSQLVEKLAEIVDTCTPEIEFRWAVAKKLIKIWWESPLLDIAKIYFNIAKNLPEILQNAQIAVIDQYAGKYFDAGVAEGEVFKAYVDGVFNLTDIINSIN